MTAERPIGGVKIEFTHRPGEADPLEKCAGPRPSFQYRAAD